MTPVVIERIEAALRQQWNPEQIAGRLAAGGGLRLSPQRIYQHIQAGGTLYHHLSHSQKKRKKRYGKADTRGQIKDRVSIVQWSIKTGGYLVMGCSSMTNELVIAKSIKAGGWLLLPR